MKFLSKLAFYLLANLIGLITATYFVPGFYISTDIKNLLIIAGTLTIANLLLKPALKIIFAPFLFLSLGLFSLVINAIILKLIDIWSVNIAISGIMALIYATLIITAVNLLLTFIAKSSFKKN